MRKAEAIVLHAASIVLLTLMGAPTPAKADGLLGDLIKNTGIVNPDSAKGIDDAHHSFGKPLNEFIRPSPNALIRRVETLLFPPDFSIGRPPPSIEATTPFQTRSSTGK
jgi:hypothetical protein